MITVTALKKNFGARTAVNQVSFEVEKGTVLGFLGPNGAGKTTTIRMIAGFLMPTEGSVTVLGHDVQADPVSAQRQIGYMPERTPLYEDMTVEGFLRFIAEVRGYRGAERTERADQAIRACMLDSVRHQVIDTLSKGYRQRTCLAQAILHDPPVLLLDEPTEGLDPNQKQVVREMIARMASEKVIIISTHVLEEVEAICNRVIIISNGSVVADGTPAALKQRSKHYNEVHLSLGSASGPAVKALSALDEVHRVEVVAERDTTCELRITPKQQAPVIAAVLKAVASHGWPVTDLKVDGGRLEEVFRQITRTEDAA
ncbi:MAG: ABC transporter ATP-binding protein [Kiritimatiellae bacterium]|nr:ABC transporter ATP-binding protein [Kiritimatiellia bacterium]